MTLVAIIHLSTNILGGFGGRSAPNVPEPLRALRAQKARHKARASALNMKTVPTREASDDLA